MLSYAKCLCAVAAVGDMRVQDPPRRPQSGGHGVVGRRGDEHTAVRSSAPSRSLARVRSCCAAGRCLLAASARRSRAHARCDLGGLRVWGSGGHGIIRRSRASTTAETAHSGARTTGNDSRRPWVPSRVRPVPGEGSSAEAEVDAEQRAGSIDLCASTSNGEEQQTKTKERMEYHVCVCVLLQSSLCRRQRSYGFKVACCCWLTALARARRQMCKGMWLHFEQRGKSSSARWSENQYHSQHAGVNRSSSSGVD